jgi:hypothetical protein
VLRTSFGSGTSSATHRFTPHGSLMKLALRGRSRASLRNHPS